jgi:hypothetical protein
MTINDTTMAHMPCTFLWESVSIAGHMEKYMGSLKLFIPLEIIKIAFLMYFDMILTPKSMELCQNTRI